MQASKFLCCCLGSRRRPDHAVGTLSSPEEHELSDVPTSSRKYNQAGAPPVPRKPIDEATRAQKPFRSRDQPTLPNVNQSTPPTLSKRTPPTGVAADTHEEYDPWGMPVRNKTPSNSPARSIEPRYPQRGTSFNWSNRVTAKSPSGNLRALGSEELAQAPPAELGSPQLGRGLSSYTLNGDIDDEDEQQSPSVSHDVGEERRRDDAGARPGFREQGEDDR